MRKPILLLTALIVFNNYLLAQNSMVGDGFGGRGWYKPHNYSVGAYTGFTVCTDSNQLYAWGGNSNGEFGNGQNLPSDTPVKVSGMSNVKFYTTGYLSGGIKKDSSAWVWGNSFLFISGFPQKVLDGVKFIDAGVSHIVFVKFDGTVWAMGSNAFGELGAGTTSLQENTPIQMTGITNAVRAIALGMSVSDGTNAGIPATIILLADGTVKITGGVRWFQTQTSDFNIPVTLAGLSNIIDIKGNDIAGYALNSVGKVYSFGKDMLNSEYLPALGLGYTNQLITPPTEIVFPVDAAPIVALSANNDGYSCLALDSNHKVYAWGYNIHGQLGDGTYISRDRPTLVATNVIDIFAGENFSYILKADSSLWATGESGYENDPPGTWGSIWMNLSNVKRNVFTQIDPTIPPMNLCAPKVWGVLPIKLSSFNCIANNNNAILNWQSAEETNANKYIVEYSTDGRNFQSVTSIIAKGSNSKYNYIHQQVSGIAFYRLKMIDKDGSFTYSEIRSIKFNIKNGFTIAPNPANDVIHLYTKSNTSIKNIQVISTDGRIIETIDKYNNGQQINISMFNNGTYILKVIYNNGETEYGRFIIN